MKTTAGDWHLHCNLPDGTELQEHRIKTERNVVIGDHCQIDYGIRGSEVVIGDSTKIREYIWAEGDVRIDNWCEIGSNVITRQDAYIGEGVKIRENSWCSATLISGRTSSLERALNRGGE
jgi:predicted acyltransferase (DUF342 family)